MRSRKHAAGGGGLPQDAQVNIASIIDCFTVLITYILAAASFLSLGALDAGIAGTDSGQKALSTEVAVVSSVHLHMVNENQFQMKMVVNGQKSESAVVFTDIPEKVMTFKNANPTLKTITLSSEDQVNYQDLVKVISVLKKQQLSVVFSGKPEREVASEVK